jgi:hypothetical protein
MQSYEIIGLENVCIKIPVSTYNIYILGIYRPPKVAQALFNDFLDKFELGVNKILKKLKKTMYYLSEAILTHIATNGTIIQTPLR